MRVRLLVLILLGIIVIFAGLFSVYYYRHGNQDQYDEYIIKYSMMKDNPELNPVDPAIVKAIISLRTNFRARIAGNEGEMGLMFVPKDGAEKFKDFHGEKDFVLTDAENNKDFGLVCPNRVFPTHTNKLEVFSRAVRKPCPVCQARVIEALLDPEINIKVGAWYLAYLNSYLHENIEDISETQALDFSLIIFNSGLAPILADIETQLAEKFQDKMKEPGMTVPEDVVLLYMKSYMEKALQSENLMREIQSIKKRAEKFRPGLENKARKMGIKLP